MRCGLRTRFILRAWRTLSRWRFIRERRLPSPMPPSRTSLLSLPSRMHELTLVRRKLLAADAHHPLILDLAEKEKAFDTAAAKFGITA